MMQAEFNSAVKQL